MLFVKLLIRPSLFSGGSLCFGGSGFGLGGGSFFTFGSGGVRAAHAATFATGSCSRCFGFGGFVVEFFGLALFKTFGHGGYEGTGDEFDRFRSVIVGRDDVVDVVGVAVGVDHGEYGDAEMVCFGNRRCAL